MTPTDFHTFLRTRRSIRRFKADPVPDSVLADILQTALYAPSAHNRQPWRFAVITDSSIKQKLADEMEKEFQRELEMDNLSQAEITKRVNRSHKRIMGAPAIIMLCMDISEMDSYPDKRRKKAEFIIATQSVANAGMQVLLAAHAEGLGGVWVCSPVFAQKTVQAALDLPKSWEPQAMLLLGYAMEIPPLRERKSIKEITKWTQTSLDV